MRPLGTVRAVDASGHARVYPITGYDSQGRAITSTRGSLHAEDCACMADPQAWH